jgi:hypothetical protein
MKPLSWNKIKNRALKADTAAVDSCYRKAAFKTELERLEYLFGMYKELVKGAGEKKGRKKLKND